MKTVSRSVSCAWLVLASIDLDTGKTTAPGEYRLADKAYADLLERIAALP